ncbi:hypothetical protein ACWEOV_36480 [Streptomyces sp. NPDC004365]
MSRKRRPSLQRTAPVERNPALEAEGLEALAGNIPKNARKSSSTQPTAGAMPASTTALSPSTSGYWTWAAKSRT